MVKSIFSEILNFLLKYKKDIIISFCLFAIIFVWFSFFAILDIDPHHDGIMLKPALDVSEGRTLFKDTFTQYGALTTYLQALALKILGKYLIVIRLQTVLFYALSIVLLYFIWKNFLSPLFLSAGLMIFLILPPFYDWIFNPWSSIYALFCMLLVNLCMLFELKKESEFVETKRERIGIFLYMAGAFSALAFWCRQPCGLVMLFALFVFYFARAVLESRNRKKSIINFTKCFVSFVVVSLLFLTYIAQQGALVDWYYQSIRMLFGFLDNELSKTPSWWECFFPNSYYVFFPVVSLFFFAQSFLMIFKNNVSTKEKTYQYMLMFTALTGLASWHQYFPVACKRHFYWAAIPMFGFYALFMQKTVACAFHDKNRVKHIILVMILLLPFASASINAIKDIKNKLFSSSQVFKFSDSPLAFMRLSERQYLFYKLFMETVKKLSQECPDAYWLNLTDDAIFGALLPIRQGDFPVQVNWQNMIYPNYSSEVTDFINTNKPFLVMKTGGESFYIEGYVQELEIPIRYENGKPGAIRIFKPTN